MGVSIAHHAASKLRERSGQMTVELCVVFPVVIVIAVIATNALSFFGDCAEFDRVARGAVRTYASTPAHGEAPGSAQAQVLSAIDGALDAENLDFDVSVAGDWRGFYEYTATMRFHPTLFGLGLRDSVWGVPMPALAHEISLTVSPYKPGMLF